MPTSLTLYWWKCNGDIWCNFLKLDLNHSHFDNLEGVYVIWHAGNSPKTVYVGQGVIRDCLQRHRNEENILKYQNFTLYVTWANVEGSSRDGVERFLADNLNPLEGKNFPDTEPITVNLPW